MLRAQHTAKRHIRILNNDCLRGEHSHGDRMDSVRGSFAHDGDDGDDGDDDDDDDDDDVDADEDDVVSGRSCNGPSYNGEHGLQNDDDENRASSGTCVRGPTSPRPATRARSCG